MFKAGDLVQVDVSKKHSGSHGAWASGKVYMPGSLVGSFEGDIGVVVASHQRLANGEHERISVLWQREDFLYPLEQYWFKKVDLGE